MDAGDTMADENQTQFAAPEPYTDVERPLRGMRALFEKEVEAQTLKTLVNRAHDTLEAGRWFILKRLPAPDGFPNYIHLGWDELPGEPEWTFDVLRGCWTTNATMAVGAR